MTLNFMLQKKLISAKERNVKCCNSENNIPKSVTFLGGLNRYFLFVTELDRVSLHFFAFFPFPKKQKPPETLGFRWFAFFYFLKKWSWRDSNPRPNKEHIGFLHAYSVIDFRTT